VKAADASQTTGQAEHPSEKMLGATGGGAGIGDGWDGGGRRASDVQSREPPDVDLGALAEGFGRSGWRARDVRSRKPPEVIAKRTDGSEGRRRVCRACQMRSAE
jgi:hypothetical protein